MRSGGYFNAKNGDSEDDLLVFPMFDLYRLPDTYLQEFWWLGRFANGTQIVPGNYTLRIAALVPFGDRAASDDWDIFSAPFEVVPLKA